MKRWDKDTKELIFYTVILIVIGTYLYFNIDDHPYYRIERIEKRLNEMGRK